MSSGGSQCHVCSAPLSSQGICAACAFGNVAGPDRTDSAPDSWLDHQPAEPFALPAARRPLPARFGAYELRREIAAGGMGVVYEALHLPTRRVVALKMLRSQCLATDAEMARFRLEAAAVAQLDHASIVPLYEAGELEGQPFFTMKLIDGGSLADRLRAGPVPPREAATLMARVARAVHHSHERGVLHRDIKPGNILLDSSGDAWLTDFGLARMAEGSSGLTMTQAFLGTPEFMSPEQAAGRTREIGPASDVWALGAILYQLISGRLPFNGENHADILRRILTDEPVSLTGQPSTFSGTRGLRDLETIALRCLVKEPARRLASAGFFAAELERWLAGEPILSRRTGRLERSWRWLGRHRWQAVAAGAVCGAIGTLAVSLTNRPQPPPIAPTGPPAARPHASSFGHPARIESMIAGPDRWIWGVSSEGGGHRKGTIFRFRPQDPENIEVLAQFSGEGPRPLGLPGQGSANAPEILPDGSVWGSTQWGGRDNAGVIFRVAPDLSVEIVFEFGNGSGIRTPRPLHLHSDGWLWGSARAGCAHNRGGIFRFHPETRKCEAVFSLGSEEDPVKSGREARDLIEYRPGVRRFIGGGNDAGTIPAIYEMEPGRQPHVLYKFPPALTGNHVGDISAFCRGKDGALYFVTTRGGRYRAGSIERLADDQPAPVTVYHFNGRDGSFSARVPIALEDGTLCGGTFYGGEFGQGVIYAFTPRGNAEGDLRVLASIRPPGGDNASLCQGPDGTLYGAHTDARDSAIFRCDPKRPGSLRQLAFLPRQGWPPDPGPPREPGGLAAMPDGSFLGTCKNGGTAGSGTIFRWREGTAPETIHEFPGTDSDAPGALPIGQPALGSDGALYGTTDFGGEESRSTVYRFDPATRSRTVLATVSGIRDQSGMVPGPDGALYGTMVRAGVNGSGSVFRIIPATAGRSARFEPMADFTGPGGSLPGWEPGPLVAGRDGALYGATMRGGPADRGTVFRVTAEGVQSFAPVNLGNDGPAHRSVLAPGEGDWLYGMPLLGLETGLWRVNVRTRTVESLTGPDGKGHGLYGYCGLTADGSGGFIYVSRRGGSDDKGAIFRLRPDGSAALVAAFTGESGKLPGADPSLEMIRTPQGLYGTCPLGGANNRGVIFRLRGDHAETVAEF